MKISVCYITKNEEKNLARSLASAAPTADEIILVDTGSTDKTCEIARSYGAKVYPYTWQDDFSGPRNFAIEQATGDYILFLDADEYVAKESCTRLRQLIEQNCGHDALLMKRYDIDTDETDILGEIFVLRAFRRRLGLRYTGRIHEELCEDGQPLKDIGVLNPELVKLYHTGYEASVNKAKAERNLRILQEELKNATQPGRLYMYLAEACRGIGDMAGMENYARLDIAQGRRPVAFASRSYRMLLSYLAEQGRESERYKLAAAAVKDFPELPEFWAELAICQAASYEYAQALASMKKALQKDREFPPLSLEPKEFSSVMVQVAREKQKEWQTLDAQARRLKIISCLIARNEAGEIESWLAKASVYSDEILVVDTGSEDGTAMMAQQSGARVLSFDWQDDFAAARNFALEQVPDDADWIVFLDADETFYEPQRLRGFLAYMMRQQPDIEGVQVPIVNVDMDAWGREIQRFRALRIWRNRRAYRYRGVIHEALYSFRGEIRQSYAAELAVRHTGYSAGRIQQKLTRNLQLIMKAMQEQGEHPLHFRYLADCLYGLHEYELAAAYAQKALQSGITTVAGEGELYRLWLHCARKLQKPAAKQLEILAEARQNGCDDWELLGWQGIIEAESGKYEQAQGLLTQFLQQASAQDLAAGSNAVQGMMAEVYAARAVCRAKLGDAAGARLDWQQALAANPYHEEILQAYYQLGGEQPADFLAQVAAFFADKEQGYKYLAAWAVRFGHGRIISLLTAYLPQNQRQLWELFAKGQHAEAGEQASLQASIYVQELFAALVMLPVDKRRLQPLDCHEWAALLPAAWERVIARIYGWRDKLPAEDWPEYQAGLQVLQGFVGADAYQEYALVSLDFPWEQVRQTAALLAEQRQWQAAYTLLAEIPADQMGDEAEFWYQTGRCLYHLQEWETARECLTRAVAAGSTQPDLPAYQAWIARREKL
ncbi:Glycosyltransferase involved in cell wall bisynthesis [Selenomonas ruminantium]|uniref:Glycosyltransferase involved in cell wall bisynthesis n=1 Tax=Selenomonas ruminantium TaxID=971 RepID=A0A1I3CMU2_SELRU|nr:glycosyltransferase [Selenomonas ruminantium]SFH75663.1 Glycosyltransferase involved in cell wall bisynthesis [Selenomonas ruminantium]